VLVLSPDHGGSFADLDDRAAGLVMAAVRDRMEEHARHANVRYTQAIVNHGREAGASIAHPHGQLLGIPFVPGELAEERSGFVRFEGSCLLCTMADAEVAAGHRVVLEDDRVLVVCPFWSGSPFEMLAVAKTHETHLARATPQDVVAVGRALRDVLVRLRRTVGDVAYNVVFHTAPHHQNDEHFHWHAHVIPRVTSIAGFEQGTGVLINIVSPELAAQQLTASD
jgi:UDPglucose--hexose-1-phosphate uridylyltransferase